MKRKQLIIDVYEKSTSEFDLNDIEKKLILNEILNADSSNSSLSIISGEISDLIKNKIDNLVEVKRFFEEIYDDPIMFACKRGDEHTFFDVLSEGYTVDVEHFIPSVIGSNITISEFIFSEIPECINYQDNNGFTGLHHAISSKNAQMWEFLLNNGACVNIKSNSGLSAIDTARSLKVNDFIGFYEHEILNKSEINKHRRNSIRL